MAGDGFAIQLISLGLVQSLVVVNTSRFSGLLRKVFGILKECAISSDSMSNVVATLKIRVVYIFKICTYRQERPYHDDSTASRLLSEVKHRRARLVLRWGTTLESLVLFFCNLDPVSVDLKVGPHLPSVSRLLLATGFIEFGCQL